eukprot:Em0865g1a
MLVVKLAMPQGYCDVCEMEPQWKLADKRCQDHLIKIFDIIRDVNKGSAAMLIAMTLVLQKLVSSLDADEECAEILLQAWYLDNGALAGTRSAVLRALHLIEELGPALGLHVNLAKCEMFSRRGNTSFPPETKVVHSSKHLASDCIQRYGCLCEAAGGKCVTNVDGYYVLSIACILLGLLWMGWQRNRMNRLQAMDEAAWKLLSWREYSRRLQLCQRQGRKHGPGDSVVAIFSSLLSCNGQRPHVYVYLRWPAVRSGSRAIITYLAIADFVTGFGYIMGSSNYLQYTSYGNVTAMTGVIGYTVRPNFRSGDRIPLGNTVPPGPKLPREYGPPDRVPWLYKTN